MANQDQVRGKSQIERDIEKSLEIQASLRKDAPAGITMGKSWVDPRETLARRLVPDGFWQGQPTSTRGQGRKGSIPPKMCAAYYAKPDHADRVAEGWEPVLESGEHAGRDGDLLYKRPIEFSKRASKQAAVISQERLKVQDQSSMAAGLVNERTEIRKVSVNDLLT